ncbi:MAG: protein kinase [Ardenticatenaceae bacterium]|nr:protein kinase [Ardenticatenaceae bacterium]
MTTNLVGQRIANYQITALLGQGRIGMVYQALDLDDQRPVALKVVSLHLAQQPGFRQRFLQEVQALPRLEHPSIIKVTEAGVDTAQDILYMTMDYVVGRSLTAYLQQLKWNNQTLLLGDTLLLVSQVADALDYAHQRGVIHRDIRPNVILFKQEEDEEGEPIRRAAISDFGLQTLIQAEKEPFQPSLPYMSPEQCLGQDLDGRSDIYSLGILLYELVVGQRPFNITTLDEARRIHPYEDPPSPQELCPELPASVVSVILKAIAKRRSDRYQTGSDFAEALRQCALELPDTLAVPTREEEIERVDTHFESAESIAASASQWFSHDDKLTITQDVPYSLSRQIVTIGRDENNDIVLQGDSVTRRHAQLERTATGWQVRDLGSKNGTFLDGTALLPDIPAEWNSYQTLRIGPYFLQIQPGKGFAFNAHPLVAEASPDEIEVLPGKQQMIQLAVLNQGKNPEEFQVRVDRLPTAWVTLPNGHVTLQPGAQTTMPIMIHPPLSRDVIPGKMRYLLTIQPTTANREQVVVPGTVNVQPAADIFSIDLETKEIQLQGVTRLTIRNEGIDDRTYTILGQNAEDAVRFGEWRNRAAAASRGQAVSARLPSAPKVGGFWGRLPFVRRLQSIPRTVASRAVNTPRQWLNSVLPGLGSAVRFPSVGGKRPSTPKITAPKLPAFSREGKEHVTFAHELQTQVMVPAGQEAVVVLSVAAKRRPLFGRNDQSLPFEFRVFTPSSKHQMVNGQVHVRPRIRVRRSATLSLIAIVILLFIGGYLYARYLNPTLAAILTAPRDMDGDGLSNLAEVYRYGTDPNEPDEDNDGLVDGEEIELKSNPHVADTDEDDLTDGREKELGTDVLVADTDGDELSDGLEVRTLLTDPLVANEAVVWYAPTAVPTPTALPTPTPRPTLTPTPSPVTRQESFTSLAAEDGFIAGQDGLMGVIVVSDSTDLRVGDSFDNTQQFKTILSFDTSTIPDGAVIDNVQLHLRRNTDTGQPFSLGQVHVDIAPLQGFGGNLVLELGDFAADTAVINAATLAFSDDWADGFLPPSTLDTINRQGVTQFRLYFTLSSNNNGNEDWLSFYAADETDSSFHPQLIVTYTIP